VSNHQEVEYIRIPIPQTLRNMKQVIGHPAPILAEELSKYPQKLSSLYQRRVTGLGVKGDTVVYAVSYEMR